MNDDMVFNVAGNRYRLIAAIHFNTQTLYLRAVHGLKQTDLAGIASQGTISDVLSGRRAIGKALAKKLAARFHVAAGVFL